MKVEESSQTAELNSDHRDIDPGHGTGFGGFVIAHEAALVHQPAEGARHDPAARQDFEALGRVGAFNDLDSQFGAACFDPLGEGLAGIATIHPQDAQPGEPAQDSAQKQLGAGAFGGVGWGHGHAEHQPHRIHQQMPLAAFDAFGGVITHETAVPRRLDTLTVQNRGRGPAAFVVGSTHERAQRVVEGRPLVVERPFPEDMIDGFPRRKIGGQITPRAATLDDIEDGIQDAPPVGWWASAFGGFGEHRLEVSPLGIGEAGFIYGVFHAPTEAALKMSRPNPYQMSTRSSFFFHSSSSRPTESQRLSQKPIIQTHSKETDGSGTAITPSRNHKSEPGWAMP